MRRLIALILLLSLILVGPTLAQESETTVTDIVSNNFLVLTETLQNSGVMNTLAGGEYTVFAPTNGAFRTMLNDLDLSMNDLMANQNLLEGVLTYHIIPGIVTSSEIRSGNANTETVNGANLSFSYDSDVSRITINGGEASIVEPDVFAANGVVHEVDNVLLPPNIDDLLSNPEPAPPSELTQSDLSFINENFVVLSAAIDSAGLKDDLASGSYTIFAPTDGAFQTLLNEMDMSEAELLANPSLLQDVLAYHVLPGRVTTEEMRNGTAKTETLNGADLSFGYDDNVSRVTIDGGEASIAQPNIYTNNGIVHIIDNVLLPPQ